MTMHDEEQLDTLRRLFKKDERDLMEKLAQKKAKLKAAEGRIRARISVRERKRRTRRPILIGSYMEHVTQTGPDRKARHMKGLDGFLERDRDPANGFSGFSLFLAHLALKDRIAI